MYFKACEQLADQRPSLRSTAEAIDALLYRNQGRDITLAFLTHFLASPRREIAFVFDSLRDDPDFSGRAVDYCQTHEQPLSPSGQCDLCDEGQEITSIQTDVIKVPVVQPPKQDPSSHPAPPRVLISYSHDSPEHADRVLQLANALRGHGVDCRIDREDPDPDEGWTLWMKNNLREAKFVLCVCTETYKQRFDGQEAEGVGRGVQWEARLTRNYLYRTPNANKKFRVVLLGSESEKSIPDELRDYTFYRLDDFSMNSEVFKNLFRLITEQEKNVIVPLGPLTKIEG
ncbi:toll/interleukin-1 receptor domain-containing protein [Novipirellula rosea]|uniref:SEFIR domain-containing protein n=1 Tax=Novipirellula rosea TaxID=1031540 RepID=A0ABP8MZ73_9BACT